MDNERKSVKTMLRELWGRLSGKKALRVGGYSVLASVIVLAIAVALNVLVNALPSSWTQYDTTSSQVFSISEQTEGVLAALEEDVTVYWVVQSGQEDETLGTLLDRYAALSSHITVEKRDPDVYPAFMEQYITGTIYNNSLVVESAERYTYVGYDSLYSYSYDSSYNYVVTFSGESELTSAIDYVVSDDLPVVYTLSGHGEEELSTSFSSSIEALNVEVNSLSLIETGEIPADIPGRGRRADTHHRSGARVRRAPQPGRADGELRRHGRGRHSRRGRQRQLRLRHAGRPPAGVRQP